VLVETLNTAQSTNGRQLHYVPLCTDQLVPTVAHFMISLFYRRESVNEDTRHGDSVCLLCHAVPTQKYPSIGVMVCSPVAGSVVLSCLDYGITTSACILLYQVKWLQSAMNPAACPAGVFVVQVRAHHSTPLSATHCPLAPERIQCKLAVLACECCHG